MFKFLLAFVLLVGSALAVTCPVGGIVTPNIALCEPPHGQVLWDTFMNADLTAIDAAIGSRVGVVSSVNGTFVGGLITITGGPVTSTGTLAETVSGISGGVVYFTSGTTWASSGLLTANLPVIGGGAGTAPTVGTVTGNTTQFPTWTGATTAFRCIDTDGSGNLHITTGDCSTGGSVTNIATTSPISGGPITVTGTISCPTCATGPGSSVANHLAIFSGTNGLALIDGGAIPTGTVTSISTTSPLTGGTITSTGTLGCATCVIATSPGAGIAHFAGSTQSVTSSLVVSSDLTTVLRRRTVSMVFGSDNGATLADADLGPQGRLRFIPFAATVVEVTVAADAGTPNIIVRNNHAGAGSNFTSSALATAAAGGIACSNTGGTTGIDGTTTCTNTLQNTSIAAGDYIEVISGTAGGTAKRMSVFVTFTVN